MMMYRSILTDSFIALISILLIFPHSAYALRNPDLTGDDAGAAAVYRFDESGGDTAFDSSGVAPQLNLRMSTEGNLPTSDGTVIRTNAVLQGGYLTVNPKPNGSEFNTPDQGYESAQRHRTFLVSDPVGSKFAQCMNGMNGTNGFTIQVFVRSWFPFHGSTAGNTIVGLSNSEGQSTVAVPNFALLQSGRSGDESALLRVRSGTQAVDQASVAGAFSSVRQLENPGRLTEIIATREPSGVLTVYVNRIARSSLTSVAPNFTSVSRLVVGNELVPLALGANSTINVAQQRNWSGEIHHLAIYCRGFTRTEILGAIEGSRIKAEVVRPQVRTVALSGLRQEARRLIERLSGTVVPVDHPMVIRVEQKLSVNDRIGAAKIVTGDLTSQEPGHPEFLNTVVKQLAMKMSNREETIRAPLNDFAASFIGVARDERNAQELLTGDFFYMANPSKAKVRTDVFRDILVSNNHFDDLEKGQWDLGKVLMRVPSADVPASFPRGQQIAVDVSGTYVPNPDPAGVITSRAFMSAHAIAGTNRRLVEYAFLSFMCVPMSEMADTSASPARIGRDIDRLPGGDGVKFETSCKGCHTVMDGFRGAFARFDFANITVNGSSYAFVRNTQTNQSGSFGFATRDVDSNKVVRKMNHNENVFTNGYEIIDDSFVNNATGAANRARFGWSGANARGGVGVNQFGQMIASSTRFSQCMAKRVFETVCAPGAKSEARVSPTVEALALKFQESGYKLRSLFQNAVSLPSCQLNVGASR